MVAPQVIPKDTGFPDSYKVNTPLQTRLGLGLVGGVEKLVFVGGDTLWMGDPGGTLISQAGWGWGSNGGRPHPSLTTSYSVFMNVNHPISSTENKTSDVVVIQDYLNVVSPTENRYFRAYSYADGDGSGGIGRAVTYVDESDVGLRGDRGWSFLNSNFVMYEDGDPALESRFPQQNYVGQILQVNPGGSAPNFAVNFFGSGRSIKLLSVGNGLSGGTKGGFHLVPSQSADRLSTIDFFGCGGWDALVSFSHLRLEYVVFRKTSLATLTDPQLAYNFGFWGEPTLILHGGRVWGMVMQSTTRQVELVHVPSTLIQPNHASLTPVGAYRLRDTGATRPYRTSATEIFDARIVGHGDSVFLVILTNDDKIYFTEVVITSDNIAHWTDENRDTADTPHWVQINTEDPSFTKELTFALDVIPSPSGRRIIVAVDCDDDNYRIYQQEVAGDASPTRPRWIEPVSGSYDRKKNLSLRWSYFHIENLPQNAFQIKNNANDEYLAADGTWNASAQTLSGNTQTDTIVGTASNPWADTNGEVLRLSVRVRDSNNNWSSWSEELRITASEIAPATITAPVEAPTKSTSSEVTWTTPGSSAQTHYQVQFQQSGSTVINTGWVESADKSVTLPVRDQDYTVIVFWQNAEGLVDESIDAAGTNVREVSFDIPEPTVSAPDVRWRSSFDKSSLDNVIPDRGDGFHYGAILAEVIVVVNHSGSGVAPPTSAKFYRRRTDITPFGDRQLVGEDITPARSGPLSVMSILDHSLGTLHRYQWMAEIIGPGSYFVETAWGPT